MAYRTHITSASGDAQELHLEGGEQSVVVWPDFERRLRGITRLYPRNVNTMITCALATVGLDRCRARLVASPSLNVAVAEVTARGKDGSLLTMRKEQPASGVSGTEMFESQFASIVRAAGLREPFGFV